jgi:hypothetical protein
MTRHLAPLAVLIALPLAGCGSTVSKPHFAIDGQTPDVAKAALAGKRTLHGSEYETTAVKTAGLKDRLVGDYVVFKFTGAFRKGTIQLTETVVAHEGDVIVVDFAMLENIPSASTKGGVIVKEQTLRAKIDTKVGSRGEVFGVQKVLKGGALEPATVGDWEAMMAKTVLSAEANEETYGTEVVDIKVLNKNISADRTAYKVIINGKPATMTITASDNFVWGDLAGEIVDDATGNVLYKAELVDSGHTIQPFFATDDDGI